MSRAVALVVLFPLGAPPETFRCQRLFIYQGKVLNCDSNLRPDGEHLRPIIEKVPAAVSELDLYQDRRRSVQKLAYLGTAGVIMAVGGSIVSRQFEHPTSAVVRNVSVAAGLTVAITTALIGIGVLRTNEEHLGNAVKFYNQAHPENPIELQFSTNISF
jgi:hypothetical protein